MPHVRSGALGEVAVNLPPGRLAVKHVVPDPIRASEEAPRPGGASDPLAAEAADRPQADLCRPTKFDDVNIAHIPKDVVERFYGCGSPIAAADVKPGELFVDLDCGAGIDVFMAAKKVSPERKAIGVDMAGRMLEVARSPDKDWVFAEIWKMLKDGDRTVISDIVSEREVPPSLKTNAKLSGECTVGALTEDDCLTALEEAGVFGVEILKKIYWKSIQGHSFYSVTVCGFKLEKTAGCKFVGQRAVYLGPMKVVIDEEGHTFPRGVAVEVCTDKAFKLRTPPYASRFVVLEPGEGPSDLRSLSGCAPGESCCRVFSLEAVERRFEAQSPGSSALATSSIETFPFSSSIRRRRRRSSAPCRRRARSPAG